MSPIARVSHLGALAALLWAAAPTPGRAQVRASAGERGWIGVSVELLTTISGTRTASVVTVTDVSDDSPAEEAGIRPGDVLVSLNGLPGEVLVSMNMGSPGAVLSGGGLDLSPGDPVRVVLERDGRRRELSLRAGRRPDVMRAAPATWAFTLRSDSVADRMFRAIDSLKVRLFQDGTGRFTVVRAPGAHGGDATAPRPDRSPRVLVEGRPGTVDAEPFGLPRSGSVELAFSPEVRAPFTLLVLDGPERDSLRAEMERLNREIRETRAQEARRVRELAASLGAGQHRIPRDDPQLQRIERRMSDLRSRSAVLQETIEKAAREELRARLSWRGDEPDAPDAFHYRPLAPYVLGQNRAAGAEVVDLQPGLAEYFEVSGGVLVVDVADGTPAALAGILPGDVLTHVSGRAIGSIAELRVGLGRAGADAEIGVVRKGRAMRVRLVR